MIRMIRSAFSEWRVGRRDIERLASQSDHMLRDIGLARDEIRRNLVLARWVV